MSDPLRLFFFWIYVTSIYEHLQMVPHQLIMFFFDINSFTDKTGGIICKRSDGYGLTELIFMKLWSFADNINNNINSVVNTYTSMVPR